MPNLTLAIGPEGPIVTLQIGVTEPRRQALIAAGLPVPAPITVAAIIDTGASGMVINAGLLAPLGLTPTGVAMMNTASSGAAPVACNQYDVSVTFLPPALAFTIGAMPILEVAPLPGIVQALLGRDALAHCLFLYHGESATFSLAF